MSDTIYNLEEVLFTELGYERTKVDVRNFAIYNRFYSGNDFVYMKLIKDRSPEGMWKLLKGDAFRWQVRVGMQFKDGDTTKLDNLIITLWDTGKGVSFDALIKKYIDRGKPVFMARKIRIDDNMLDQVIKHSNYFETYALAVENECPKCNGILVPRKAKKLRQEDPYALARKVSGKGGMPKQRVYLACNDYPECNHIASYVKDFEKRSSYVNV